MIIFNSLKKKVENKKIDFGTEVYSITVKPVKKQFFIFKNLVEVSNDD